MVGKKQVTRKDVAERAGVSVAVVSYVVNDGPRPVSSETKAKVEKAIEELGYYPNELARSLSRRKSATIGLITPRLTNPVYAEIAASLESVCSAEGYLMLLCATGRDLEKERKMRLGFHGATSMTSDLETDVMATAHAGLKALELWVGKIDTYLANHSLADLRALLADNGVAPMSINSLEFISFRGDEYPQIKARCREMCELAQAIGCPTIVVVPSPTPSRDTTWDEIVEEHVAVLRDLGDIAAQYAVNLSFELLGFGWCSVRTPRGAWEIVQKAGRANVGLVVDCAHVWGGGGLLDEIAQVDAGHIFTFHLDDLEDLPKEAITDAKRIMPGQGVIPLGEICQRLKDAGYDGDCSVELFRPEYWERDPLEVAKQVRESAERVLSPYFEVE
jgi:2-keto-myo-inositol isomerase